MGQKWADDDITKFGLANICRIIPPLNKLFGEIAFAFHEDATFVLYFMFTAIRVTQRAFVR